MYVDQSMLDPIQHSESVVSSSCLERDTDIRYPIDHGWFMDAPDILSVD